MKNKPAQPTAQTKCLAEKVGRKVGDSIWMLAGTRELICKGCKIKCPYSYIGIILGGREGGE